MTQINPGNLITFVNETTADADQVDQNFETLRAANNELDSSIKNKASSDGSSGSFQTALPVTITSDTGTLTLLTGSAGSTSFVAEGDEAISSITGWTKGIAFIRWNSDRALIYSSTLLLQDEENRIVKQGDISVFEFSGGIAREINFFPVTSPQEDEPLFPNYKAYSVSAGAMDSNGYANFITSLSNSSIEIEANTTDLRICHPNGTIEIVDSSLSLANLSRCKGSVTSLTCSGTTATVITSLAHNLQTGDKVTISGSTTYYSGTLSYYNGTFTVTVTGTNSFTYTMAGTPSATTSAGTIYYAVTYIILKEYDEYTVTSLTRSDNTITAVTNIPTSLQTGDNVTISGAAQGDYNGTFTITVTGSSSFTYNVSSSQDLIAIGTITAKIGQRSLKAITTNQLTESFNMPSSGQDGDYWLCYGVKPYKSFKKINSAWKEIQFTKLGECTITNGIMSTPVSYAFNGMYISPETVVVNNTITQYSHNIGATNVEIRVFIKCTVPDFNYDVGAIAPIYVTTGASYYEIGVLSILNKNISQLMIIALRIPGYNSVSTTDITPARWNKFIIVERAF